MISGLSYKYRDRYPRLDPLICGFGLLSSAPFLYAGIALCKNDVWAAYALVFMGEVLLNMNWAVVVDISMVS